MLQSDSERSATVSQPSYQLRPNKAVDRLTLIDAIRRLAKPHELGNYTYYSMGGPTLEDFRLIYEFFPEIRMVCIEQNDNIYKRQQFHLPCRSNRLKLHKNLFASFLSEYEAHDRSGIFWLDYTDLEYSNFDDFMRLLPKAGANSLIKITLRCNPLDYKEEAKSSAFFQKFAALLPGSLEVLPIRLRDFAELLQKMVQIAAQTALPSAMPQMLLPLSSFYYNDGTGMFTFTGVICRRNDAPAFKKTFKTWQFANLDWSEPNEISVPSLSTKERLHLQRSLPCRQNAGRTLQRALGYLIGDSKKETESKLQQYADFHRYFPYFIKAIP